jgi:hypothetical protein
MQQNDLNGFDEFDDPALVQDDLGADRFTPTAEDNQSRRKRQSTLYVVLFFVLVAASGGAWFVLSPKPETAAPPSPTMAISPEVAPTSAPTPTDQVTNTDLPQGVTADPALAAPMPETTQQAGTPEAPLAPIVDPTLQPVAANTPIDSAIDPNAMPAPSPVVEQPQPSDTQASAVDAAMPPVSENAMPSPVEAAPTEAPVAPVEQQPMPVPEMTQEAPLQDVMAQDTATQYNTAAQDALPATLPAPDAPSALPQPTSEAILPVSSEAPKSAEIETTAEAMAPPVADVPQAEPAPAVLPAPEEAVPAPQTQTVSVTDPLTVERLNAVESQLQTLASEITANKPSGTVDPNLAEQLKNLADRIEKMAAQMDALDQRTASLATELQRQPEAQAEQQQEIEKKIIVQEESVTPSAEPIVKQEPAKKVVKKPAQKKPVVKKPIVVSKPALPKVTAPAVATGWELRSAQPGVAWLGRAGSADMTRYAVGDNVPSLGTIQTVAQDANGNWVVRTTGGTVQQ